MNLHGIAGLKRDILTVEQRLRVNGETSALPDDQDFARGVAVQAFRGGENLGEGQAIDPGDVGIAHIAEDADVGAAGLQHARLGLLLALQIGDAGLGMGFGSRGATTASQQ